MNVLRLTVFVEDRPPLIVPFENATFQIENFKGRWSGRTQNGVSQFARSLADGAIEDDLLSANHSVIVFQEFCGAHVRRDANGRMKMAHIIFRGLSNVEQED